MSGCGGVSVVERQSNAVEHNSWRESSRAPRRTAPKPDCIMPMAVIMRGAAYKSPRFFGIPVGRPENTPNTIKKRCL